MKKIILSICLMASLVSFGQVVSATFGSTANEANAEWTKDTGFATAADLERNTDSGFIQVKSSTSKLAELSYTGTYSRTAAATDVIQIVVGKLSITTGVITTAKIGFTETLAGVSTDKEEILSLSVLSSGAINTELPVTSSSGVFTDGATISNLTIKFTNGAASDFPSFDRFLLYSFKITDPTTLSSAKNNPLIKGAKVELSKGEVVVNGASLDEIYSITGKKLKNGNLATGVYIVKISKDNLTNMVKVISVD